MEEKINGANNNSEIEKVTEQLNKIKQLLMYTKGKDDIIAQLGKDLQHYRDGFTAWAFKPFVLALIDFRESCKKDILSLAKYDYDVERIKKNVTYLSEDFNEMLLQNGLEESDGGYLYNGQDIASPISYGVSDTQEEGAGNAEPAEAGNGDGEAAVTAESDTTADTDEVAAALDKPEEQTLGELLESYYAEFLSALKNNSVLETAYLSSLKYSAKVDADNKLVYIYPALKRLIALKNDIAVKFGGLSEDNAAAKETYREILDLAVGGITDTLEIMGCSVMVTDDVFNTTQHRLLKTVATDDESLDRAICTKLTDAYTFEGKVIFLQKVEVYKFKK